MSSLRRKLKRKMLGTHKPKLKARTLKDHTRTKVKRYGNVATSAG